MRVAAGPLQCHHFIPQPPRVPCSRARRFTRFPVAAILRTPLADLGVQGIVQSSIESVVVWTVKHHGQVFAIRPIYLISYLLPHPLVKNGTRKGIRDGYANAIGAGGANQLHGSLDVFPAFAGVPELDEIAGADALPAQALPRIHNLVDS